MPMREDAMVQPVSPYGVTKLAAEHLCHLYYVNHGVPTVSLRYFTVYGPRQRPDMGFNRFFSALLEGRPVMQYGDGFQTRDFTFIADIVTATAAAAVQGVAGRVYNIGGGSRVSLCDVFACRAAAWRSTSSRHKRATCAIPTRIRRVRGRISVFGRPSTSRPAFARCSLGWKRFGNDEAVRCACSA
jgi:nucleoside-diphosphate-sugar epimerase